MITTIDLRVETLAYYTTGLCRQRRTSSYRDAMRAANTGRGQIGGLLYDLNVATVDLLDGLLLSSVVRHSWEDWPGEGYFDCAVEMGAGLRPGADVSTKRQFWKKQIAELFAYYERLGRL